MTDPDLDDPCAPQTVIGPDGARLVACAHGGHVLGWTPAGAGARERLWLSPTARCGPGSAIRGGIPVIFPQFAGRGPLPKHGLARDRAWRTLEAPPGSWRAELLDDEATRRIWPHSFALLLTATAVGARLEVELLVRNTGSSAFGFTAALHGYLAVADPATEVLGAGGRVAEDNAAAGAAVRLGSPGEALRATAPRDVAVRGLSDPLDLVDPVLGTLRLSAEGFGDRVLWNPGPGHGLADVPDGDEAGFVCLEAAVLEPVTLAPGEHWTGRQVLAHS